MILFWVGVCQCGLVSHYFELVCVSVCLCDIILGGFVTVWVGVYFSIDLFK